MIRTALAPVSLGAARTLSQPIGKTSGSVDAARVTAAIPVRAVRAPLSGQFFSTTLVEDRAASPRGTTQEAS
jgi:hypothetical protein